MSVLFLSYTGVLEPLGRSQVLPYVRGLSRRGHTMRLLSFEKESRGSASWRETRESLASEGIAWYGMRYHKSPPVLSTAFDVVRGLARALSLCREGVRLIHARSHVPALIADLVLRLRGVPFIFDHRGLMADEYADAGLWPEGGVLYRATERWERKFLKDATRTIVLSERLRDALGSTVPAPIVIPCAVDLEAFRPAPTSSPVEYDLIHAGSWSGLYLADKTLRFFELYRRLHPEARMLLLIPRSSAPASVPPGVDVRQANPEEVPAFLRSARAGLSLRRPGRAQIAASPVKISEYWASGIPVVSNAGVGDLDRLIEDRGVGVILNRFDDPELERGARALSRLRDEGAAVARRCRALAEERYDLARALDAYDGAYREVLRS